MVKKSTIVQNVIVEASPSDVYDLLWIPGSTPSLREVSLRERRLLEAVFWLGIDILRVRILSLRMGKRIFQS
jgi:hypothetical protein